jgi:signal transduction histidine kinase
MIEARAQSPAPHLFASLREQLDFERLISELSATFIDLPADQIDGVITAGLRRIVETLGIDRSSLTLLRANNDGLQTTHSWAVEGLPPVLGGTWQKGGFSWLFALGNAGKPLVFSRLSDLPPEADFERRSYQSIGLRSHVAQPLMIAGELVGFLGFGSLRRERIWPDDLVARMRLLANIFAAALARRDSQRELDQALAFERLLADLSTAMLRAPALDVAVVIPRVLQAIGEFLRVDRVSLWQLRQNKHFLLMHSWCAAGVRTAPDSVDQVRASWLNQRLLHGEVVHFSEVEELPSGATLDRSRLRALGIRSLLSVPLRIDGNVGATLALATLDRTVSWSEALIPRVKLIGEALASLLERDRRARALAEAQTEATQFREHLAHVVRVHTVGEMSAALAHEITQPLGAIKNYATAARTRALETPPDIAKVVDLLGKVSGQAARAGDIVTRLRGLAKRHDMKPVELDVARTVDSCIDMVRVDCALRGISIELKAADKLPRVVSDEIHVQQVVLNLLRNAIEASAPERPGVPREITVEVGPSGPDALLVRVADRGAGIPEGELERVFESFYSTKPLGIGIGLAICRKLIEAHGGVLWASHNPGGGAVFQFTLPLHTAGG